MSHFVTGKQVSRRKAVESAEKAVEKTNELVARHEETIVEVARTRKGLEALQAECTKRLDAQLQMIAACEKATTDLHARFNGEHTWALEQHRQQRSYVDSQDHSLISLIAAERTRTNEQIALLTRRQERFEQMGFWARTWWWLTGTVRDARETGGMI